MASSDRPPRSHTLILSQHESCLRYFAPDPRAERRRRPLFLNASLINTWRIFDLVPRCSLVGRLTAAGIGVYVQDWGRPWLDAQDRPLSHLIDEMLPRALRRARRHAIAEGLLGPDEGLHTLGYSVGGTFLAISLSRHPASASAMGVLAAPIDFHQSGLMSSWIRPDLFPVDDIIDAFGNFPQELMTSSFSLVEPLQTVRGGGTLSAWMKLIQNFSPERADAWWALQRWKQDGVAFPGECYREYVRRCYFDNALMQGGWSLGEAVVDLSAGMLPAQVWSGADDSICPPAAAEALSKVWGGPVTHCRLPGNHLGLCLREELVEALVGWLSP